jgi:hypothetical protein
VGTEEKKDESYTGRAWVRRKRKMNHTLGERGYGGKERYTGRFWAAGFHHFTARLRLAAFFKFINLLFL